MRVVFFGTPHHAAQVLRAVIEDGHEVVLVVTQPDRRRGRGGKTAPSPVKEMAESFNVPVTHRVNDVLEVEADVGVLVAFGRLIKSDVLRHVTILNIHPSLLPRWRGATPGEAAILAGDSTTGVCVMKLVEEMDAGPVYARIETNIRDDETAPQLYARLFAMGTELLLEQLRYDLSEPQPQVGEATYCGKLTTEDFHVDWSRSAESITRLTRVGKAWTTFRGSRFSILEARLADIVDAGEPLGKLDGTCVKTGEGWVQLVKVQPEGKPAQDAEAWLNGARIQEGEGFE